MSFSSSDARFLFHRARGLIRRGLASLRTRGWRASWERVKFQFRRKPRIQRQPLYLPGEAEFAPFAVPASDAPRASIIIPVYGQSAHTVNCLRALAAHPPSVACEIIVVDDGSPDQTAQWMPQISGLRYHRRVHNGGFIAACNDGAALANGEYLVFLNNDTIPQPGWLDALLSTFAIHPDAGLVGAQLLYPDGRLQEAGGVVFADGSAWNYGRFDAPEDPRFASVRDADYCSGAALAIPRELFQLIGGFDTRYAPAYYEDTDLAFSVRARGHRVLYQPAARVVHLEGITSGTDTGGGVKAYQVRNREIFADKWRQALALQRQPDELPLIEAQPRGKRQVLILDAATPQPDRDSASLRLLNLMRLLQQEGAHVVFVPADLRYENQHTDTLRAHGIETWHAPFATSLPLWLKQHGPRFDVIALCRHYIASELLPWTRKHAPQASLVFDTVDLHYLRETRGADIDGDNKLRQAALKTRRRELALIEACDITLVVSPAEQSLLASDAPQARVEVLSNLHEIAGSGLPFAQRRDLVFVGGFRHPPNVDAVRWFVDAVFPLIRAQLPDVEFHCIGSDPPDSVLALARQPGVRIHGYVPDVAPYMDSCRIALAPLRFGAGVKGKINLSMAHGQPVVATSCAAEGMHLRDGWDVLIADDPAAYAAAVVALYRDEVRWNHMAGNGLDNVRRHFSLDAARAAVRRVFFA